MRSDKTIHINSTFIDLLTDYGFKRIFGTEKHKEILRRFLNALFEGKISVANVEFHDKEILPRRDDGKRVIFDIYCTTDTGHHFIVEMQQEYGATFEKRIIHYAATGIVDQTNRGNDYDFRPVYTIVFTDFDLRQMPGKMVNEILLAERTSHRIFSEDVKIFFLSLKHVKNDWDECANSLEKMLYIIKNMEKMDKESKAYKSGEYPEIFEASEIASMAKEDVVAYSASLQRRNDIMEAIDYARNESYNLGISEGEEKERIKSMRLMASIGVPESKIAELYGIAVDELRSIL